MSGFDYNSMMALKQLIAGEQEPQIVENAYKGSSINPAQIDADANKKETAKPNAKIQAKIGQKYQPRKAKEEMNYGGQMKQGNSTAASKSRVNPKYEIWSEEQVADLPISKHDPRKQPFFETMYRQKVGTQDVFLGLGGTDPSSNCCQQITYRIELPNTRAKDIQLDLNEDQMVIQTKDFYLNQHFQYKTDPKQSKAKFVAEKSILQLILPILRNGDF